MKCLNIMAALVTGTLLVSGPVLAEQRDLQETAEAIRDGGIDVGTQYSINRKTGRFHQIHAETVGLECEGCHVAPKYASDYLLFNKHNAELKAAGHGKGKKVDVVDRSVCLGCHKTEGVATVWYRTADK